MPESVQEERLRWVLPLVQKQMRLKDVLHICPHSRRSLLRWCAAYRQGGEAALVPKSTAPKTQPHETPIRIKEEVIALRKKTGLCARKLHWRLKKQGLAVPVSTIGKIIKQERLVRRYRTKRVKYKYLKVQRQPGELVEIDVKFVPGPVAGQQYFQYTAIDREPLASPGNLRAAVNLACHALDRFCALHDIIHYLIDSGKPAQNGTVERSHREDEEKFYQRQTFATLTALKRKLRQWNTTYNNLEHCGLGGKTPNEVLALAVPKVIS